MIVIYLYVCSIYDDDDDDDDEATRESPETRGRGLCSYLGFFRPFKTRDPKTNANNRKTTQRERVQREREIEEEEEEEEERENNAKDDDEILCLFVFVFIFLETYYECD